MGLDFSSTRCKHQHLPQQQQKHSLIVCFLACSQHRILTVSDSFQCGLYGNGILLGILYAFDAWTASECPWLTPLPQNVVVSICKDRIFAYILFNEKNIPGSQPTEIIPMSHFLQLRLRLQSAPESLHGIKTVYYIEHLRIFRCLLWKVCSCLRIKS